MLKQKAIAIFFILFSTINVFSDRQLFDELFPEGRISVQGISHTDFIFNGHQFFGNPINHEVIIHGWSRSGLIFYTVFCLFSSNSWSYVKDLTINAIVWDQHDGNSLLFIPGGHSEIVNRFGIEPDTGSIGQFPFTANENVYEIFVVNEEQPIGERNFLEISIYLGKNDRRSKLGTAGLRPLRFFDLGGGAFDHIIDDVIFEPHFVAENLRFWYVQSPFEERIAVIVIFPGLGISWALPFYRSRIFGGHLNAGFN